LSGLQGKPLLEGEIDVGFVRCVFDSFLVDSEILFEERLVVHVSKASPLAKRRSLRIKDLAGETVLLPNRQFCPSMYDKTLELFAQAGISPSVLSVPLTPSPNSDSQIVLVACRKGIFIMPDEASGRPHPGGEVVCVPLDEPDAKIAVWVTWRKNEKSTAVLTFLESVRRVLTASAECSVAAEARPQPLAKTGREIH